MKNSQSVQHEPSQTTGKTPNLAKNTSLPIEMLVRHPWMLLLGLLAIPVSIAIFAFNNLIQVADVAPAEPEKIQNERIEESIKTSAETGNSIALWMVFAIALSCGTGSWIIWRWATPRPKQSLESSKHLQKVRKHIKHNQQRLVQSRYPRLSPSLSNNLVAFVPPPSLKEVFTTLPQSEHLVTVLPPEESHHLDDSKESLADLLDIRKQSSLSSILRK
ncbi:hypothetical protein Cylst_0974 [Cylindrospermum stagnale PCC 7417]|uniref:Uncharacterized protein n=1 Tax=Cylindrospermum stagnale PCC 7417 TaxID=56107 RepID=K9WSV3_9NOST|nr:hypothetical protein [Cylindrospermum stagnale]AFZ23298.1 hypothetical protein Cylst_0974 [Cylindrospermum stagnale PCC 7417]